MEVEEESALPYEVTREEAKAWLKNQMAGMVGQARDALIKFLGKDVGKSEGASPEHKAATPDPAGDRRSAAARRAVDNLSPAEKEALETKARSLRATIAEIGSVVDAVRTGEAAKIESARERIGALRRKLEDQGIRLGPAIDELPNKLRDLASSLQSAQQPGAQAERLEETADLVEDIAGRIAQGLRDMARAVSDKAR
jgi:outer membrane murein-binding lipoprotein Lpp